MKKATLWWMGCLLAVSSPVFSQEPALRAIPIPDTFGIRLSPVLGGAANEFDIAVNFPDTGSFRAVPDSLGATQLFPPTWQYFWMFEDGYFTEDSTLAPFIFNDALNTGARLRLTPTYSKNKLPSKQNQRANLSAGDIGSQQNRTVFTSGAVARTGEFFIRPNWPAAAPGDTLSFGLPFRNLNANQPNANGTLFLILPPGLTYIRDSEWGSLRQRAQTGTVLGDTYLRWDFSNLQPPTSQTPDERTLFVDLLVEPSLSTSLPHETSSLSLMIQGGIDLALPGQQPGQRGILDILGIDIESEGGLGASSVNDQFFGIDATEFLTVNLARDPNNIIVDKPYLPPGDEAHTLTYRINFQNMGAAAADSVIITSYLDSKLDLPGSFQHLTTDHPVALKNTPTPAQLAPPTRQAIWSFRDHDFLVGVQQAQGAGASLEQTKGFVSYRVDKPAGTDLQVGDRIVGQALISMDGDTVRTNEAVTLVRRPRQLSLRPVFGIKVFYGGLSPQSSLHQSTLGLSLTARLALGGVDERYLTQRRIPFNAMPVFWLQWEVGAHRSTLDLGAPGTLQLWQAHLTPLMLRFVPNAPNFIWPQNKNRRFLGLSADYQVGYALSGDLEGTTFTLPPGIGPRLDHSLGLSLDFFNILGRRGLSFGAGWRWHRSNALDPDRYFNHPFYYAHWNF